ncbi:MAG: hypothetical protein ACLRX7_02425 [Acutalibacteraceae bacterium]
MQSKSNKYIHIGKIIKLQKASIEKRTAYQTAQQTFGQAQLYQKQLEEQQENVLKQKEQMVQLEKSFLIWNEAYKHSNELTL